MQVPAFLEPYSHWVLGNRNFVIVILCIVLFVTACHALISHWQVERLDRELAEARRAARSVAPRRMADESAEPGGGNLPPVRGGRTYARNLGNALQKAGGPANPSIYSPPVPAGWTPNVSGPGASPQSQTPFPAPWSSPGGGPPANQAPWGFNQPGRQGVSPGGPVPQFPGPMAPSGPAGAHGGPTSAPGFPPFLTGAPFGGPAGGPSPAAPYGPPPMPSQAGPLGPAQPPIAQQPGQPGAPALPGDGGSVYQPPAAAESPDAARSKAKRRRFNFSVLENLEKMVQQKPAESPAPSLQPPMAGPASPAAFVQPAPPAPVAPATPIYSPPAAPPAAESKPQTSASDKAGMPSTDAGQVSLDLPAPASESAAPQAASAPSPEPSIQPPVEEEKKDFRKSMRSMLFGEEPSKSAPESSSTKQEETATSAPTEDKASVSNSWPWSQIGKSSAIEESPAATPGDEPAQTTEETSATDGADAVYGSDYSFGETGSTEQQPESTETDYSFKAESEPSRPVGSDAEAEGSTEYLAGGSPSEQETEFSFTDAASDSTDGQVEAVHEETTGIGVSEEGAGEKESTDVEPSADSSGALAAGPAAGHGDGRGTVVIIEDDQSVADYYSTLFKGNGYQVEVANDGVSGVDLCARVQPSVILLDVMMPRQNGILVLQTLRASDETRNTPVVVLSNFSEPTLIKRALQLGALEYVIKTQVEGSALLDAMTRWINREKAFAA